MSGKKLVLIFSLWLMSLPSFAQSDLSISPAIVSPVSGCYLSSTETVTVIVVNNLAAAYGGTFDISYSLNGGPVIVESVTTGLSGSGGAYIYSFPTTANLTACQIHTLDFVLTVPGDINLTNNVLSASVASDCAPTPGSINAPAVVCSGLNSGNLEVVGFNGNVQDWAYSTDNGASWTWTGNTATTQPYTNINTSMQWWVLMGSPYGFCDDDSTDIITINTVPQTNPGVLPANFDICDNGNWGTLNLTGYVGNVLNWEVSSDFGVTWTTIPNTTDVLSYSNLADTFMYQVQVQNSICPAVYSPTVTLTLIPGSDAGVIVGEQLVCNFENDSSFQAMPVNGNVVDWVYSTDNANNYTSSGVSGDFYYYTGLLENTIFGAIVQEGACPYDTAFHSIIVLPLNPTAGPDVTIFLDDSTQLLASGGTSFFWFPDQHISDVNIPNPYVSPEFTTTYYVQITDINGCTDTAEVTVTVDPNLTLILVPNLLTPNGDDINDYLIIPNIEVYPYNELHIFNSYGQVIYYASPYNNEWQATYNGTNVPDGTYFYILNLNDTALAPEPFKGVITIIGND